MFAGHGPAWVETLENRVLLSGQSFIAHVLALPPGTSFDDVPAEYRLTDSQGTFNEVGVFQFDADGTIAGLAPGDNGFEDAVMNSPTRRVLFDQNSPAGSTAAGIVVGGRQLGIYFCRDAAVAVNQFHVQMTPAGARAGFDEVPPIWPAVSNVPGSNVRRFDDIAVDVNFGGPVRIPIPTIAPVSEQTVAEQEPLEIPITAQNPAGPLSDLRYQLDEAPDGAAIDPMTGLFSWTPSEAQGPGRFDIVVRVFNANRPDSFATVQFVVNVTEVNTAPVIAPIEPQQVAQLEELSFRILASDADRPIPLNRFTFSLVDNMISGAVIDPETGEFTWTPSLEEEPGIYTFTVRVVDTGTPALEDIETFTVEVLPAGSETPGEEG